VVCGVHMYSLDCRLCSTCVCHLLWMRQKSHYHNTHTHTPVHTYLIFFYVFYVFYQ
jgi:hypothetical protein